MQLAPIDHRYIKKYHNRRLYDLATSSYVTLQDVRNMVLAGDNVIITDAKTNVDITCEILLQIILEQEEQDAMFSKQFLVDIIRVYGKTLQGIVSQFLDNGIQIIQASQQQLLHTAQEPSTHWLQFLGQNLVVWQNNLLSYLHNSTNNFLNLHVEIKEQLKSQTDSFIKNLHKNKE